MNRQHIEKKVIGIIKDNMHFNPEVNIIPSNRLNFIFSQYEIDSIDQIEIIMELENEFKIKIPDNEAEEWKTVEDIIKYIESKINENKNVITSITAGTGVYISNYDVSPYITPKAIVTTSANPFHYGHLDLYNKAKQIFADVKVVIAQNSDKNKSNDLKPHMDCYGIPYEIIEDKTIADYCKENSITHIVRGIRNGVDAEYELKIDFVNKELNPDIQTIFIPTSDTYSNVSSSTIRELLKYKKYDVVKKFMREDAMIKYVQSQHLDDEAFFKKMVEEFEKKMEQGY